MTATPAKDSLRGTSSDDPTPTLEPTPLRLWADESELPGWVREAAKDLDLECMLDVIIPRCIEIAFPTQSNDEEFRERLAASTRANATCLRSVIAGEIALEDVYLEQVLNFATVQAQLRIPQKAMQRSYRISFFTMWETWSDRLAELIRAEDVDREEASRGHRLLTQTILGYQDFVAAQVAETYTRDYEALSRSRSHMRRALVRGLLKADGDSDAPAANDVAILQYELADRHLAIVLPAVAEGAAAQLANSLRAKVSAQHVLVHPVTLRSTAIWLGRIGDWKPHHIETLTDILSGAGVAAAIGEPHAGVEGFRRTFREAVDVEQVREAWGANPASVVVRHRDVGLEILLMQDHELARTFVERELGPLTHDTLEAERLRETLEASFRFGSHVAAAEHLQLHEHTVRNRLHKAEEQLGHPLSERRTELQVAARLIRLISIPDAPSADSVT